MLRFTFAVLLLAAWPSGRLAAWQCPDGAPPPCARATPARAVVAPDPNRIAVLPFRVSGTDTSLAVGLAELLAPEFTGESGPRAVNMGTVLRAWRAAGGDVRAPLAQDRAIRLARDMGAGFYVEGSVVGLGPRLTINASVIAVPGGAARRAEAVAGPTDSLDVLVGRLTSTLLAAAGSERAAGRTRLTDSPAAMRSYLEGLAQWRAGGMIAAAAAFGRAAEQDSMFAPAVYMRWLAGSWRGETSAQWARRAWSLRERLSSQDRLLLESQLGTEFPRPRTPAQRLADYQQAANRLPESAEAQFYLGDFLYHSASSINVDAFRPARTAIERSVALDSMAGPLQHLVEIALQTGDTSLAQNAWAGYDRLSGDAWDWGMAVAALRGDQAMLAAQRRRARELHDRIAAAYLLADALIPTAVAEELFDLAARHGGEEPNYPLDLAHVVFEVVHGRPGAATRFAGAATDMQLAAAARFGDGDSAAGAGALVRLRALSMRDTAAARGNVACLLAFEDLLGAGALNDDMVSRSGARCRAILAAVRAVRDRSADARERLLIADSLSRNSLPFLQPGHDRLALARAWEQFGDVPRALAAVRVRAYGFGALLVEATRCREEGRLAALAGDTASATLAYRRYLALRQDAEPVLVPQRDSVRAELARLERR